MSEKLFRVQNHRDTMRSISKEVVVMKKTFSLSVLVLMLTVVLSACGGGGGGGGGGSSSDSGGAAPAGGRLDTTFDADGKATAAIGSGYDNARDVAIQSDGKIVVAGYSSNGTNDDFALARFNSNGSLDTAFDTDGKATTVIGSGYDQAFAVAIQSDGKIVVAGFSHNVTHNDFALVRYNSDGSLDTTFDTDGKVTTDIGASSDDVANSIAIQSDGKIVIAGASHNGANYDFALARYNSNGSLDTTFDADGKVTTAIGIGTDFITAIAIQSDGKIVVAGISNSGGTNDDFALARYNSNGSLDTTFDADGKATTAIGGYDNARGLAIQSDGKIVVAGSSSNGTDDDFMLARYNSNGSLDTTFDADGIVTTAIGTSGDIANAIAIQSDGKIVVAGISGNTDVDFVLARYNSNGSLDTTFGAGGKVTTNTGGVGDEAYAIAIQSDGKIVVAGDSWNGFDMDFTLVRYWPS